MVDFSEWIQRHLSAIGLPVYNELRISKTTETPCLTWRLDNDYNRLQGDNLGFSWVQFAIKIWCTDKMIMSEYVRPVDLLMRNLGLERISSNELWAGGVGQLELRYRGSYRENY